MDHSYPYIASLTREPFLFYEMRSTAKLMNEGLSDEAIVKEIVEQNLFQYPTEKSITRMAKACIKRLRALEDESLISAITSQPTEVAKQICPFDIGNHFNCTQAETHGRIYPQRTEESLHSLWNLSP